MILSKVQLNMEERYIRSAVWDCQKMHQLVTGLFGTERRENHILYRLNSGNRISVLYLYSDCPVVPEKLLPGMSLTGQRDLEQWLKQLSMERPYGFDLIAMPAKKVAFAGTKNSRRVLLRTQEERLNWLAKRAENGGFCIHSIQELESSDSWGTHSNEQGGKIRFTSYHYQGLLTITDKLKFMETLQNGIGPEKAYGLGMLLLR